MERVHRFLRLSWTDKTLLVQSMFLLAAIRVGLYLLPFRTLRHLLAKVAEKRNPSFQGYQTDQALRVVWAVGAVGRYLPSIGTCLMQALAAHVLLGRRRYPTQLHIGVTRDDNGKFLAHAWLESHGTVVIGGEALILQRYKPLLALDELEQ